jgi:hypothetical protein
MIRHGMESVLRLDVVLLLVSILIILVYGLKWLRPIERGRRVPGLDSIVPHIVHIPKEIRESRRAMVRHIRS